MKRATVFAGFAWGVAVLAMGANAQAADMPARTGAPVYKAPAPIQTYNWTGFYTGVNAGYAWGRTSWSDPLVGTDSGRFNSNGAVLGGQLGYNWQTYSNVVLGIESDIDWTNLSGSTSGAGTVCATNGGGQCQTQQTWIGSTRLRLGYAVDRWLPYVTGGVAYGNIQAVQPNATSSASRAGWALGGGVEYGITPNWSTRIEYMHLDLGTATFMGAASGTNTLSVPLQQDIVRAGLNYRW